MSRPKGSPRWATSDTYPSDAGPDAGALTKIAPPNARIAQGWRKDVRPAPQYQNYWQHVAGEFLAAISDMKTTNFFKYPAPSTAGNELVYDPIHKTIIALGNGDTAFVSQEPAVGTDWTATIFASAQAINLTWGVCNPAGVSIFGGDSVQKTYYSVNGGFDFSTASLPSGLGFGTNCGIWDPVHAVFMATGLGSNLVTSPDGITWTRRTGYNAATANTNRGLATDGLGKVVSLNFGTGGVSVSTDGGITWAAYAIAGSDSYRAITYNATDQQWVIVGDHAVVTSPDGAVWQAAAPGTPFFLQDVTCDGAITIATVRHSSLSAGIAYSVDAAQTWSFVYLRDYLGGANHFQTKRIAHFRNAFHVIGYDAIQAQAFRSLRIGAETPGSVG